jgi:hypothetical protein
MLASITARQTAQLDLFSPICIYGLCAKLGVGVRFNDLASMEGMYDRGTKPRIHLSALRPLPRRAYTCGHELGHHVFGHGSTIDELREEAGRSTSDSPEEILADAFAAFALMPTLGLRRGFAVRGWQPETASPREIFTVACEFGVGYATLVTHLAYGITEIPRGRVTALLRTTPKSLRADILGEISSSPLIIADQHFASPTLDAEVGTTLMLPPGAILASDVAVVEKDLSAGRLFRCTKPGIARAVCPGTQWSIFVRVSRYQYVGLAQYRHLEEVNNE